VALDTHIETPRACLRTVFGDASRDHTDANDFPTDEIGIGVTRGFSYNQCKDSVCNPDTIDTTG